MATALPRLLTVAQAVAALEGSVSDWMLRKEIDEGRLRARRIGRCLRIVDEDLAAWVRGVQSGVAS